MVLLALANALSQVPAAVMHKLEDGEIVVTMDKDPDHHPRGKAYGVIGAPPERVWETLTDFDHYPRMYTGISRSEARKRLGPANVLAYFVMDFPWPISHRWVENDMHLDHEAYAFDWKRVEGSVKHYEGAVKLLPWRGGKTLMQFEAVIDPGIPLLPEWLLGYLQAQSLPGVVSGPRDYLARTAKAL